MNFSPESKLSSNNLAPKLENPSKKNNLELKIQVKSPRLQNREWTYSVVKTINQEYYIMDGIAFVGIIGGTMGLFVGLSFMDINTGIVELLIMLVVCKLKKS